MNSELIINQSEKLFIIEDEDDTIQFKINNNSLNTNIEDTLSSTIKDLILASQTKIKIRNISNEFISFRVKTTKKKNYIVKPCYYILSPKEILNIKIIYYIHRGENINTKGHKFKFEGFIISNDEKEENPKKLFLDYITKGKNVKGTVIKKYASFIEEQNMINSNIENEIEDLNKDDENKKFDEFEDLKIEYYKLKGKNENLRLEYFNLKKLMEMELTEKNNKCIQFMQFKYDINTERNEKPISTNIFIICFIISIILGFFLIK